MDGLLAYDRACREGDALAHEFLGLLEAHEERRRALEERAAAEGSAAAGMEAWADWRATAERLAANGRLVLEALGARAGEAAGRIAACLDRFDALLLLDDTVPLFEALLREVEERRGRRTRSRSTPTAMTNFWSWPARSPRRRSRHPPSWRPSISSSLGRRPAKGAGRRSRR